jgi:hypothetical protein
MRRPLLLDERSRPDFGDHYLRLLQDAREVVVATSRIRLRGLRLDPRALGAPARIRVLLVELSGLTLSMEAERLAEEDPGRERLLSLVTLLDAGRLQVRSSPLGGWAPDFSVFTGRGGEDTVLVGPHWLDRPYPHRGPALGSLHAGAAATAVRLRFEELWAEAHPVGDAILGLLTTALERCSPLRG